MNGTGLSDGEIALHRLDLLSDRLERLSADAGRVSRHAHEAAMGREDLQALREEAMRVSREAYEARQEALRVCDGITLDRWL